MAKKKTTKKARTIKTPATQKVGEPDPAAEILKKKVRREAEKKIEQTAKDNAENIYYIKCARVGTHHAAYLTERPGSTITPGHWYSIHHKAGDPWPRPYIPCQECYVEGEERVWRPHLTPVPRKDDRSFDFTPNVAREHVFGTITRAELEERQAEIKGEDPQKPADTIGRPVPVAEESTEAV